LGYYLFQVQGSSCCLLVYCYLLKNLLVCCYLLACKCFTSYLVVHRNNIITSHNKTLYFFP
jgi:hypothetical protein